MQRLAILKDNVGSEARNSARELVANKFKEMHGQVVRHAIPHVQSFQRLFRWIPETDAKADIESRVMLFLDRQDYASLKSLRKRIRQWTSARKDIIMQLKAVNRAEGPPGPR